jgi:cation:H+ antiporter
MMLNCVLILGGLALLVLGAQGLVRGASRLALVLGIPPLVVGLTIVAFGTSAPELAVSLRSCLAGKTAVVLGNVVGSNIYNVLFILGVSALITPLAVSPQLIRWDVPIMIGCAAALNLMAIDGTLGRPDGAFLLGGIVVYTLFVLRQARRERASVSQEYRKDLEESVKPDRNLLKHVLFMAGGLGLLALGSDLLVRGAVAVAQAFGVSEVVIGMTVVTIGTTAPELSACIVAALRGDRDIAVGNIVGSNIFNILAVLGVGALAAPRGIAVGEAMAGFGLPVMAAVCFSCLPVFFAGGVIRRWEGALFLFYFVVYLTWLVLDELEDLRLLTLRQAMLWFVLPLTVVTLAISVAQEVRRRSNPRAPKA